MGVTVASEIKQKSASVNGLAPLSRRNFFLSGVSAVAVSSGVTLIQPRFGMAQEALPDSNNVGSEKEEVTAWARSGENSVSGKTFVSKTIMMKGCWDDTRLSSGIAWG